MRYFVDPRNFCKKHGFKSYTQIEDSLRGILKVCTDFIIVDDFKRVHENDISHPIISPHDDRNITNRIQKTLKNRNDCVNRLKVSKKNVFSLDSPYF